MREKQINGIITKAKAKWQVEGYPFFFYLEKKHFAVKHISKLVVESNQVIQDPKTILTEQKKL